MKTSTKIASAFLGMAALAGTSAFAADRDMRSDHGKTMRFEKADADSSGDVSFEEFAAAMSSRFANADADSDGKMTVSEIASEIERMRAERMARRIVDRFDTNDDGVLTSAEIESRQKKRFALLDRNDDGKVTADEMRRGDFNRHHRRHGDD